MISHFLLILKLILIYLLIILNFLLTMLKCELIIVVTEVVHMNEWFEELSSEDLNFIKKFVLASGSLKQVAQDYSVSYPTVRARLNEIIAKVNAVDAQGQDPFIVNVMRMVTNDELSLAAAKTVIALYEKEQK